MKARSVTVTQARRINDVAGELVSLSLEIMRHDELWGALRAARAAVDECAKIAMRDVDRDTAPALHKPAKRKR